FDPGIYRVFNYGGTLTDNGLALGTLPAGNAVTVQTSVAGQVNLVNSGNLTLNFWDGDAGPKFNATVDGGNGIWHVAATGDNWTDANGAVNAAYANGAFAVFAGQPGTVTIDNSQGDVSAAGLQFAVDGYTIQGDTLALVGPQSTIRVGDGTAAGSAYTATINAALTGATQLVKTDAGTLKLGGINSYTGGTAINGGTIAVSADANLGDAAGGISVDGGTLKTTASFTSNRDFTLAGDGTILTGQDTTFTLGGILSGPGILTKDGAGTLAVTGDNSGYVAETRVALGTLAVDGALGGNVDVTAAARLEGVGRVGGISNGGVVAPGRGGFGTLTVTGNYVGNGGTLEIETALGDDASPTDRLVVNGATSGTTGVTIINRNGLGAQTVEGIKIIDIAGASNGTFTLNGDYQFQGAPAVVAGAYAYRLYKNGVTDPNDGDWYLRSALTNPTTTPIDPDQPVVPPPPLYQPGVPVYEGYAQTLLALTGLPTLQERVGNRSWAGTPTQAGTGIWGRMEGARQRPQPVFSTSHTDKNIDSWQMQIGVDHAFAQRSDGAALIGGLTAQYGKANTSVTSLFGNGAIGAKGYGVGATLTWYGPDGFYADGQAQVSWFTSDLKSNVLGTLASGNDGMGEVFSLEVGKRAPIGGKLSVTPQIQMAYAHVSFDRFTDPMGAVVSADQGRSLKTRWGLSIDHQNSWSTGSGGNRSSHAYAIVNLNYEWLPDSGVKVSGTPIVNRERALWGELGLGGSYSWNDRITLYAQAAADTAVADFGNGYSVKGTAGIRIRF
ncbi:MAG: autotransporter outer membrane beta-barrel domain-containing protein, partial [Sphingobium sp.]